MVAGISQRPAASRALPHVTGESLRGSATTTKLTPLAFKVMVASGAISTRRQAAVFPKARFAGGMALLATAAALIFAGGLRSLETPMGKVAQARATALSVDAVGQREAAASVLATEQLTMLPGLASPTGEIARQDRFEIDRFIRLGSSAR